MGAYEQPLAAVAQGLSPDQANDISRRLVVWRRGFSQSARPDLSGRPESSY